MVTEQAFEIGRGTVPSEHLEPPAIKLIHTIPYLLALGQQTLPAMQEYPSGH